MDERENERTIIVFCPACRNETLIVTIEIAGKNYNYEFGQEEHWFEGTGKCTACNYSAPYSDSSL